MWIYLYEKKITFSTSDTEIIVLLYELCMYPVGWCWRRWNWFFFLQVKVKSKSEREDMWRSNVLIHSRCVYIKSDCIWMTLTVTVWSQCSGWGGQAPPEPSLSSQTPKQHTGREHLEHNITILVQEQTIHIELYTLWMSMRLQK